MSTARKFNQKRLSIFNFKIRQESFEVVFHKHLAGENFLFNKISYKTKNLQGISLAD